MSEPLHILDVGAHDGFVGAHAMARFDGDLVIDGIELHPDACARARRRGYRKVVQARAEEAAEHFKPGSYDAVVCYELIEHVPEPNALLSALERMLKPGGLLFLSTPDGTFGSGRNPHHLRALRALDLADLLRRRGRLEEMEVGADGITAASYRPAPRKGDVAIFTGGAFERWSPHHITQKGLGGSETAAFRLALALSELGWVVTVYGEVEDGCFRDVLFRHHSTFDPTLARECVISSRLPELADMPLNARVKLLWSHDTDFGPRLTPQRAQRFDWVLALSRWHEAHVLGAYPYLAGKLARVRNGVHMPYFTERTEVTESTERTESTRQLRVLCTSSPDRGLDVLLELWPEVRERVPNAVLAHAYPPYFDQAAEQWPELAKFRQRLEKLRDQPGVESLGPLSQPQLAQLMLESTVWAHPSWNTPGDARFCETYCIGAAEAQAAGLVVVASKWGAIPETVADQRQLVPALDAPGPKWRQRFVDTLVRALTDEKLQRRAQREGPKVAAELGWAGVGEMVAALIEAPALEEAA